MGVYTKFKKRAITSLYNIPQLLEVVKKWDSYVRSNCPLNSTWCSRFQGGSVDLINPRIPEKKDREKAYRDLHNSRKSFCDSLRVLCLLADVDYKHPHAFRHGHVHFGLQNAKTAEQVKAVSQNVMHNSTAITDQIYSRMGGNDINAIITGLGAAQPVRVQNAPLKDLLAGMTPEEKKQIILEALGL